MKKKFLLLLPILLSFLSNIYAFDVSLNVDKNQVDINEPINLIVKITDDRNEDLVIKDIKGLENFKIIWQQQFHSSNSQITIINWKTKAINTTTYTFILTLKAKKDWKFTLWPAIIQSWNKEYKTNTVDITVSWQIITNYPTANTIQQNNLNNFPNQTNTTSQANTNTTNQSNNFEKFENIPTIHKNTDYLPLIIAIFIILGASLLIIVNKHNSKNSSSVAYTEKQSSQTIKSESNTEEHQSNKYNINNISFLSKYWIESPETKSYSEIMKELKEKEIKLSDKERKIIEDELLNKFKN